MGRADYASESVKMVVKKQKQASRFPAEIETPSVRNSTAKVTGTRL